MRTFILKRLAILFLVSCALFLAGNNLVSITDPDEAFYSLTAHEMVAHHEWMTPLIFGQPQFEKPPLTYWLIAAAFKTWGESPFTARLYPALFSVLGVLGLYFIGLMGFKDERKAFLSALALATSAFYIGMGKTVFTDMIFSVFILYAFAFFLLAYTDPRRQAVGLLGFYACGGLSALTKTPLGFVILHMAVLLFLLYQRRLNFMRSVWVPVGLMVFLAVSLPWYAAMYTHYGHAFTHEFFFNDHWRRFMEAEHHGNDHWFFYPVTMLAGMFPWSLFLGTACFELFRKGPGSLMDHFSISWLVAVLVVFQPAHSKLASYILPLFPALALMTGNFLGDALSQIQQRPKMEKLLYASFVMPALLGILVLALHKLYGRYVPTMLPSFFLSGALITVAGIGVALTIRGRLQGALYVLALSLAPILATLFMVHTYIEKYVSSHEASAYIPPRSSGSTT
ncbi:MAG: glycosyltransferase family 39 protein, partial [Candidatus Omnitrophica bacterium]|nr:glycosyltransferase family 39 protein [Candidatus Omnitrophota bacterium]